MEAYLAIISVAVGDDLCEAGDGHAIAHLFLKLAAKHHHPFSFSTFVRRLVFV